MKDTLDSTFNLYFADESQDKACTHCNSTQELTVTGTTLQGYPIYVCSKCQAEQLEREAAEKARVDRWVAMDEWEE